MKIAEAIEIIRSVPSSEIGDYDFDEICEALDMAIEALQTDIVHCKECKHYGNLYDGDCEHPAAELGELLATEPTDFCSYGKRREDKDYEQAIEQIEHDTLYESTYNPEDGSM